MKYQDINTEAQVYANEDSKYESMVELSLKDQLQIKAASNLLAEADPT
jgi:hypothetical protein